MSWHSRVAWLAWALLLLVVCGKAFLVPHSHTVWPVYQASAAHWWHGQPLYHSYPGLDLFRYSPTFAIAVTPLAFLPPAVGGALWAGANVLALLGAAVVLWDHVLPRTENDDSRIGYLLLTCLAGISLVWNLQCNALLLAAVAFGLAALRQQRWWLAAFLLVAAVFIKVWAVAVVLLVLARWPKRMTGPMLIALLALAAIPFLTRSPVAVANSYAQWWHSLTSTSQTRWPGFRDAWTIWEQFGPVSPLAYRLAQLGAALTVFLLCLWGARRPLPLRQQLTWVLGGGLCWQLLFGPASEQVTYGILAPLLSWGLVTSWRHRLVRYWLGSAYLILVLCTLGDVERGLRGLIPGAQALLPLSVVLVAVWLLMDMGKDWFCTLPEGESATNSLLPDHARGIS
ncbi:MAG: glycosyltransferase family 87 protein [Gemmataceae bacterium]